MSATLPGPTSEFEAATSSQTDEDPINARVELHRVLFGSRYPFDPEKARSLTLREVARARSYESSGNHAIAVQNTPPWRDRLGTLDVPTLVVHGTEDPILPFPHGQALANEIPGAELFVMEGVGHALPPGEWPRLIPVLLDHTRTH